MIATAPPPAQHLAAITVRAPKAALRLQVAKTEAQREQGLMNYTALPTHEGMVFVFPTDGDVQFWMKDTLISLDMVFVGADGTVRKVTARVPTVSPSLPDQQIPLEPGKAKYVIELAAGEADADGIKPGTKLCGLPRAPD